MLGNPGDGGADGAVGGSYGEELAVKLLVLAVELEVDGREREARLPRIRKACREPRGAP